MDEKKYWRIEELYDNGGAYEDWFTKEDVHYVYGTEEQVIVHLKKLVRYDENNLANTKYGTCTVSQFVGGDGETITNYGMFERRENMRGEYFYAVRYLDGCHSEIEGVTYAGDFDGESVSYSAEPVEYDKIIEIL